MARVWKLASVVALAFWCGSGAVAQSVQAPPRRSGPANALAIPRYSADVFLGRNHMRISYGAPSMRGREVMGKLVPYGKWWRTGADAPTLLEATSPIMIGSLHLPAGSYMLVTLPAEDDWQLGVSTRLGPLAKMPSDAKDFRTVPMKKRPAVAPRERMTMGFETNAAHELELHLKWELTDVYVPIAFDL